ncbi:MAG: hypothetical protein P8Q14_06450 [Vicingaceae bacterium]|nr:hypothetical protein [Vicingaceae bacterium]
MKNILLITTLFISSITFSQTQDISAFKNLVNKKWKAEGKWGDGNSFYQEITFEYSKDSSIITTKTIGFLNKEKTELGQRNLGIRQIDEKTGAIKFSEYDIFGGLTEGKVTVKDKNILYEYQYGKVAVTDLWEYVDDNTYNFKVGDLKKGVWKDVFLKTQFKTIK